MINIEEQTITIKLDKKGSELLTSGLSNLIDLKIKNTCNRVDCPDCKESGNRAIEQEDLRVLSKEIQEIYFEMYKVSMSTTSVPSLKEIREDLEENTLIAKGLKPLKSKLKEEE